MEAILEEKWKESVCKLNSKAKVLSKEVRWKEVGEKEAGKRE